MARTKFDTTKISIGELQEALDFLRWQHERGRETPFVPQQFGIKRSYVHSGKYSKQHIAAKETAKRKPKIVHIPVAAKV